MFLFIRMVIYVIAVPLAAYIGGTYDPVTNTLTIDLNALAEILFGLATAAGTFYAGRVAKAKGGMT